MHNDTVPVNKEFTFRFKGTIVLRCESSRSVNVFLSSFLTSVFVSIIRTYIRTVYMHRLYACDKTSSGFAKIVRVSSVNLKTVFICYSKQRLLVCYGKGYQAARHTIPGIYHVSTEVEKALNSFFFECFNHNIPPIIPLDLN